MEITCVKCPVGCVLTVQPSGLPLITGNECPAGIKYAGEELTNPTRNIATSIPVTGGDCPMLSVKTVSPVPKNLIFQIVAEIKGQTVQAPVTIGDVILADASGTGIDIVTTRNIKRT